MLAPRSTPKLEDHPSSAVRDCLFNLLAATLLIGGRSSIKSADIKTICPYTNFVILCFVDRESVYNPVNKANLVHNLFSVYLSISICFGRLCAHHQGKQLCLCDTWYLLFCADDCLVYRSICSCIPDSHLHRIATTKCRINTVVSPDDVHIVARNI